MNDWNRLSERQQAQVELACRTTLQKTLAELPAAQMAALERMKADGTFEVKRFPESMLRDLHEVWLEVLAENLRQHPLIEEAHASLTEHLAKIQPWAELQFIPEDLK